MRLSPPSLAFVAVLAACAGSAHTGNGTTARPAGCDVEIVHDGVPSRPTRDASSVVERCRGADKDDPSRCLRLLQDQACRVGARVIWDVRSQPTEGGDVLEMHAESAQYR